jgi:tetratricopeptide (TPR) repeat protein
MIDAMPARITLCIIMLVSVALTPFCAEGARWSPLAPYDREIYELAYAVFLGNGNHNDAFTLADAAVKQRPADLIWRERLARVALWTQRPEQALEQWLAIYSRKKSPAAYDESLHLARILQKDETILQLITPSLRENSPENLWQEYIQVSERSGGSDQAVAFLSRAAERRSQRYLLEQLVRLSEQKGEPAKALQYLDRIVALYGITPERAMGQARLHYTRGELTAALQDLLGAREIARPADKGYWQTLGDLAWLLQDRENTLFASSLLREHGDDRSVDLERMIAIRKGEKPAEAFDLAREGWKRFGVTSFFLNILDTGINLNQWQALYESFGQLTPKEREQLFSAPGVWSVRLQVLERLDKREELLDCYREAIARFPDNDRFIAGLLWRLIDQRDLATLRRTLAEFSLKAFATPLLRNACGAGYLLLGELDEALLFFAAEEKEHLTDLAWLVTYADLLERTGAPLAAADVRRHAWNLVRNDSHAMKKLLASREQLHAAARLGLSHSPGDTADAIMSLVINGARNESDRELILLWALATDRDAVAENWLREGLGGTKPAPPPWVELGLALRNNDREQMARLLETRADDLPIRDRVEAARRLGHYETARDLAFNGLSKEPEDDQLRRQYAELTVMTANLGEIRTSWQSRGAWEQTRTDVNGRFNLFPSLRLKPSVSAAYQQGTDATVIDNVPATDLSAEIALSFLTNGGEIEMGFGWREALRSFGTLRLKGEQRLASDLNLLLEVGYRQPAPESVPLSIAGWKNELSGMLSWQATGRDTLSLATGAEFYRDQEANHLGRGFRASLGYISRIEAMNPGLAFASNITLHRFATAGTPGQGAASLMPAGSQPDAGFFMPRSFLQLDLGLYSDRSFLTSYSRRWKTYGGAALVLNSVSGIGYTAELGAAGPLFGHDRLHLSIQRGNDRFNGDNSAIIGELRYTHFLEQ